MFGHFASLGAADAARAGVDSLEHTVALLQQALDYEDSISMTDIGYYRIFALWPSVNEERLDEVGASLPARRAGRSLPRKVLRLS